MATYVITEPCIDVKDASCVEVCPVACIHTTEASPQYYIDPEICIACEQCVIVCPVEAIYLDTDVPEQYADALEINAAFFAALKPTAAPLSREVAETMISAADAYANGRGLNLTLAVLGASGDVVAEGDRRSDDDVADAVAAARSSIETASRCPGGSPLFDGLVLLGAIGVAGASAEENGLAARAAVVAGTDALSARR